MKINQLQHHTNRTGETGARPKYEGPEKLSTANRQS